jgi:ankyrin repeat protein
VGSRNQGKNVPTSTKPLTSKPNLSALNLEKREAVKVLLQHNNCRAMLQFTVIVVLLAIASVLCVTEIFDAVAKDDRAAIEAVLAEDPSSLNIIGPGGQTPLMNAVLSGKVTAVKVLLEHNADVTIPEKDGYTPLVSIGFRTPLACYILKIIVCLSLAWSRFSRSC